MYSRSAEVLLEAGRAGERYPEPRDRVRAGRTVEPSCVAYNASSFAAARFKRGPTLSSTAEVHRPLRHRHDQGGRAPPSSSPSRPGPLVASSARHGRRLRVRPGGLTKQGTRPVRLVLDLTHGEGANFQLEAAGVPTLTFPEMERPWRQRKIAQVGRAADRVPCTWTSSRSATPILRVPATPRRDLPNVIRLMASGALDNRKIITARFALDNVVEGIKQSGSRTDGKILVKPR